MENIKKSKTIWLPSADEAFLDIWGEKAAELRGPRKNSHIYAEMAQSLGVLGHEVRPIDIKYKIHNFTMKYRKCKAEQGTGCSPVSWKHYQRVHQIIGSDRVNNVDAVVVDSITGMPDSVASPAPSLSPISSASFSFSPPSSPALNEASASAKVSELNETIKSAMTENNKLTAELIDIEKKKVAAIELLTKSVVSFLERN
ncbi:uncharacterized protein LOC128856269 [Anastrepha ludens]|uniref:uncharacterized protein LOC128856269 n=1 Tax=Anastrepha ludens TaxID=28586 RepID=UPI0023AF853D|nr:uncharacterized protein LOC128856269 [Anastrepha ludens]